MNAQRLIILCLIFTSTWVLGTEKFLRAEELGSWTWSGFNLDTGKLVQASDFKAMVASGGKVARFHLEARRCPTCAIYVVAQEDSQRLDRIIGYAKSYGFKVVVVLDPFPKGKDADFWESEQRKASLDGIWRVVAKQYANEPAIAAFDLLNEPHPPDALSWSGGSEMWARFGKQLATTVRQQAPRHALIVESAPIASPGAFEKLKPIPLDNVVYSFHYYEPHRLTHQGIQGFPLGLDYPGDSPGTGYWDRNRISKQFEPVRRFKAKYRVPVQVGEFSFIRWAPFGARNRYLKDFLDLVYQEQWGWFYHAYRDWEGWDAEIDSNLKDIKVRSSGSLDFELIKTYLNLPSK